MADRGRWAPWTIIYRDDDGSVLGRETLRLRQHYRLGDIIEVGDDGPLDPNFSGSYQVTAVDPIFHKVYADCLELDAEDLADEIEQQGRSHDDL